jgi:hypothetical protein
MHADTISQAPYRSEAFAEDLDDAATPPPPAGPLRKTLQALLCILPALVALMSSAVAVRVPPV